MAMSNDILGARGEAAVSTCLMRPLGDSNTAQFRPLFLGEKAELLDFLVLLLDPDERALGPHFFLQVKTTACHTQKDTQSIAARFSADEVARIQKWKAPTYLAAVDASKEDREFIYIRGINSDREKGIASVKKAFSLNDKTLRKKLYQEVKGHFDSRDHHFKTSIIQDSHDE